MSSARTYLDYNATAPLRAEARAAVAAALDLAGNPSSVHADGRQARAAVDKARDQVAALVNAKPSEVVFTSGATEANAWALSGTNGAIAVCGIEHDSILAPARMSGRPLISVPCGSSGVADIAALSGRLSKGAFIALQWANNETGVVQPVAAAAALAESNEAGLHVDAVQAAGRIPIDFSASGATTMSFSAHKMGGPKGAGALIIRDGVNLQPLIAGGGQERRRRGGTENVAAIAGFGAAAAAARLLFAEWQRIAALRAELERELLSIEPSALVIGAPAERLPNTTCVAFPGHSAETLVIKFDLAGVSVSAGAACSSGKAGASHVLTAMGLPEDIAGSAIRISLGPETVREDIAHFLSVLRAMALSSATKRMVA